MTIRTLHGTEGGIQKFFAQWNGKTLFIDKDNLYNARLRGVYHYCTDNTTHWVLSENMLKVLTRDFKIAHEKVYLVPYLPDAGGLQCAILHQPYEKAKYMHYLYSNLGYKVYTVGIAPKHEN